MRTRIYVDTSVIGGCEDDEFSAWSIRLLDEFRKGSKIAVISSLTREEIEGAPENVESVLSSLPETGVEDVFLSEEAESLALEYVNDGVVGSSHMADAQHIAIATVEKVDVLVSWNFQHIVNLDRIRAFNSVNLRLGYPMLEIRSPREVLHEEEI